VGKDKEKMETLNPIETSCKAILLCTSKS